MLFNTTESVAQKQRRDHTDARTLCYFTLPCSVSKDLAEIPGQIRLVAHSDSHGAIFKLCLCLSWGHKVERAHTLISTRSNQRKFAARQPKPAAAGLWPNTNCCSEGEPPCETYAWSNTRTQATARRARERAHPCGH